MMRDASIYMVTPIYKGLPLIQIWLLQLFEEIMKALLLQVRPLARLLTEEVRKLAIQLQSGPSSLGYMLTFTPQPCSAEEVGSVEKQRKSYGDWISFVLLL